MVISKSEIARFQGLSRTEVLSLSDDDKMKYLYVLQVGHRNLQNVTTDLMTLLNPYNEINILSIIGSTGVGKTTLFRYLFAQLIEKHNPGGKALSSIPFLFIPAPANGAKSLSWKTIYSDILKAGGEILIEKKLKNLIDNGVFTIKQSHPALLDALRDSLESMLKKRKVKFLVIDEAVHILRFGNSYSAVMDTLKSLVDETHIKLILLGSYNLFDLVTEYGQVARRAEILHFRRYQKDDDADVAEFERIVTKLQQSWPCAEIPLFTAITNELIEASLGCIGLLKGMLLLALELQLQNKGKWNPKFMARAAKSLKLLDKIKEENQIGEKKIKGACYGESFFDDDQMANIIAKMCGAVVNA